MGPSPVLRRSGPPRPFLLLPLLLAACAGPSPYTPPVVPPEASAALARARRLREVDEEEARREAERALALAPDWIAPRRLLDDLLVGDLLGPRALAAHRAALARDPDDPAALYLAGRLEAPGTSLDTFLRAASVAPRLAWPHHGLAVRYAALGRLSAAIAQERQALARAGEPWEAAHFRGQLAEFLQRAGRGDEALAVLREGLDDDRLERSDRLELRVRLAEAELRHRTDALARRRGLRRAVRLLAEEDLPPSDLARLVRAATILGTPRELRAALAARPGPGREALLDELLLSHSTPGLGWGRFELREGLDRRLAADPELRRQAFLHGEGPRAVEAWLAGLPHQVVGSDGLPREERLADLVRAARRLALRPGEPEALRALGEALLEAGWYAEAAAHAGPLARADVESALALERRALAWLDALSDAGRLVREMEQERGRFPYLEGEEPDPGQADGPPASRVRGLGGLLHALGVVLAEARLGALPTGERSAAAREGLADLRASVADSPRIGYWVLGQVVHPGPEFSAQDERLGRGEEGAAVPGLAACMARILRFAVIGTSLGAEAPDAAILRRLWVERRRGEHLGVPWEGTIAWCDGVDLAGRVARSGALIAGAALHEGYYVDLEPLRRSLAGWESLREQFDGPAGLARARAVLSAPALAAGPEGPLALEPLLGAADRLRLALLVERGDPAAGRLGEVTLAELVEVTERHEEGHLCDRTRFYPPGRNLWTLLADVVLRGWSAGGSEGVLAELEYRAQLVALCTSAEPRLVLVELLAAAEGGFADGVPHGSAYVRLLGDLLDELALLRERDPGAWRALDPDRLFVLALHRLDGEQVRMASMALARRRGLVAAEGLRSRRR